MEIILKTFFLCIISYLIGAIPVGIIISKKKFGLDIKTKGSGNMGATNVMRILGTKWGIIVLILDTLKGAASVLLLANLIGRNWNMFGEGSFLCLHVLEIIVGLSAVIGHIFPCFAQFKGGKGIATALGMFLAIIPIEVLISLAMFVIVVGISGFVSLGSMMGASLLPITLLIRHNCCRVEIDGYLTLMYFILGIVVLIFIKHRTNIVRLIKKQENQMEKMQFLCRRKRIME
jgi:glycerol-3-phosphate acyltransferase PlsY